MIRSTYNKTLLSIIETAQIHASRIKFAQQKLADRFPVSAKTVTTMTDDELLVFELYTSRFGKLQDLMGNSLFPKLLAATEDLNNDMTFIDKLNRLEKLGVIKSAELWITMRQMRNHLAHEYPDQPELTAEYLNQAFELGGTMLADLDSVIQFATEKKLIA